MTLKECYAAMEGDYDEVFSRLRKDERIQKFVMKFLDDKSFDELKAAVEAGDLETAFRAAHTLKGVTQNLSFAKLFNCTNKLTELLRGGQMDEALYKQVEESYHQTIAAIREL